MSMLDSPMPPYMTEDQVHVQWVSVLQQSHPDLFQQWMQVCTTAESYTTERTIRVNASLPKLLLSDLYRSLETSLFPCDDTLVYGVTYPIIGTGMGYTTPKSKASTVLGYVCLDTYSTSLIHVFPRDADVIDESEMLAVGSDEDDPAAEMLPPAGDPGCAEEHYRVETTEVFNVLRKRNFLVLPLIARPAALLFYDAMDCYGTLEFDISTGQCYDPVKGGYGLRIARSLETSIDNESSDTDQVVWLNPVEVEQSLLRVPTTLFVDTRGFAGADGTPDPRLPVGAHDNTLLQCLLWYPHGQDDYVPNKVYLLAHESGENSSDFSMMICDVSWLVHPDTVDDAWRVITDIRPRGAV
jgi:hypothetical protein